MGGRGSAGGDQGDVQIDPSAIDELAAAVESAFAGEGNYGGEACARR